MCYIVYPQADPPNALGALVPCEQKLSLAGAGKQLRWSSDCRRGRTSNGQSLGQPYVLSRCPVVRAVDFAQRNRDVSGWTVGHSERRGTEFLAVQALMDHDRQLERYTISDVKLVELLVEQMRQSTIKLAHVAGDYSLQECNWLWFQ